MHLIAVVVALLVAILIVGIMQYKKANTPPDQTPVDTSKPPVKFMSATWGPIGAPVKVSAKIRDIIRSDGVFIIPPRTALGETSTTQNVLIVQYTRGESTTPITYTWYEPANPDTAKQPNLVLP